MKESRFLQQRIIRLWQLEKIRHTTGTSTQEKKVQCATRKLDKFAKDQGLPISLILNQFAYHFAYLSKETSFNKIYIKIGEFLDGYEKPKYPISDDDVEFAYEIEESWNTIHKVNMLHLPFVLKSTMQRSGIKILNNTFFDHSSNFQDFCVIANFVRNNRKNFPQIHSMWEFFLHLPIIRKRPGRYMVWQYTNPAKDLEKYYVQVYGKTDRKSRFSKFRKFFEDTDTLGEFKEVWGVWEMKNGALPTNTTTEK